MNYEDNRLSQDRSKKLRAGVLSALVSRVLILLAPLLTIPVTLDYLGSAVFGFWITVTSFTAMAAFADLGLGSGLLTRLTPLIAEKRHADMRREISSAYVALSVIAALILAIGLPISAYIPWYAIFQSSDLSSLQYLPAVAGIVIVAFALSLPLSLVQKIQYANQQAASSSMWQLIGGASSVAMVYLFVALDVGSILVVMAATLTPVFVMLVNTIYYFSKNSASTPSPKYFTVNSAKPLLRTGLRFVVLSSITGIALNADVFIVANQISLEEAAEFAIAVRLFSLLSIAVTFVALPLWPANGDALARGDLEWVRRTTRTMIAASALSVSALGLLLTLSRDAVLSVWLNDAVAIPISLAIALSAWSTLLAVSSPLFSVQNSVGELSPQMVGWGLFLLTSLPAKATLVSMLGPESLPAISAILYMLFVIPAAWIGFRKTLQRRHIETTFPSNSN